MRIVIASETEGAAASLASAAERLGHEVVVVSASAADLVAQGILADVVVAEAAIQVGPSERFRYLVRHGLSDVQQRLQALQEGAAEAHEGALGPEQLPLCLLAAERAIALHGRLQEQARQLSARSDLDTEGLYARRRLEGDMDRLHARLRRHDHPYYVALLEVASAVEEEGVAEALASTCRATDLVYRYAPGRFCVLFPDSRLVAAYAVTDRLRLSLGERGVFAGEPPQLTCGVAEASGDRSPADALVAAESALVEAASTGGNRVVVAAASPRPSNS